MRGGADGGGIPAGLLDWSTLTDEQAHAIARLVRGYSLPVTVTVAPGTFDLPEGYVTFCIEHAGRQAIYGGISKEGDVST